MLLSLCMIVKDEAFFIRRSLEAVRPYVDEIVVVDTGSVDDTRQIAAEFTENVYEFAWTDDFSAARNFSLEKASGDWVLVLDADELLTAIDMESLRERLTDSRDDVYFLNQLNYSDNYAERDWQPQRTEQPFGWRYKGYRANPVGRIFRNDPRIRFTGTVHEIIDLADERLSVVHLNVGIHHDSNGNPNKSRQRRQLNYLKIMEEALLERADGRLAARAGAVRMYEMQDYPGAIAHLRMAVDLDYDRECNLEAIAEAHYRLGEFDQARLAYQDLFQHGYATASLCNNYSNLLVKSGDSALAIEVLEKALELGQAAPERIARIQHNIDYLKQQQNPAE